jgi:hypothetical protein
MPAGAASTRCWRQAAAKKGDGLAPAATCCSTADTHLLKLCCLICLLIVHGVDLLRVDGPDGDGSALGQLQPSSRLRMHILKAGGHMLDSKLVPDHLHTKQHMYMPMLLQCSHLLCRCVGVNRLSSCCCKR